MLTPYRPCGLVIVTDRGGDCLAVVDPDSHRLVRTLRTPIPLVARSAAPDRLVVCTAADVTGVPATLDTAALFGSLPRPRPGAGPLLAPARFGAADDPPGILLEAMSGVFPDQGPYSGGTLVTIIGHHFTLATDVSFGPHPAASFSVLDDQTIVAVSPWGTGAVPVTVTTPGGTAPIGTFYYIPWPRLKTVVPDAGPIGGGNVVELTGINLSTAQLVYFGDSFAFPTAVSDQQLLVTAPPATAAGTVPVYVATAGGVSNRLAYTYEPVPSVTDVTPSTGPIAGGSIIVLTGTGLSRVTGVSIGGVPAVSFRASSDTLVVVVTPPGTPGSADITVTTPGGTVTLPGAFGYLAPTETAVSSAPDPSVVGEPVTFTATVTGVPPTTGTPTGTVTLAFGDGTDPVTVALTDGTATVGHAYTAPSQAPYAITATYNGEVLFFPSTGTDTQVVTAASTTTALTGAPDPSQTGQPVTFVARVAPVAPGAGTPTGTVTLDFGDGAPTATLPLSGGAATVDHAYADTGGSPYTVTADYSGDANFNPSAGSDTQTVGQASTSVAVGISPLPSVAGQPVTVTATVTAVAPGAGTPTGSVTFDFGDGSPPAVVTLTGGTAETTHTFTGTAGSPYTITASYSGDPDFSAAAGTSAATVGPSSTTTTVSSGPDPSVAGEPVTITATIAAVPPGAGVPTGTVTFDFDDGTAPVTVPLSGGSAETTHTYSGTSGSPFSLTATYNGDTDFTGSLGNDSHTVQLSGTVTTLTSTPDPSAVGEPVDFTATVAALPPGAGIPTGTVTFDFGDGTPIVTVVVGGVAEATHSFSAAAGTPYTVTATYNGDADFATSAGTDLQTVQTADTTTAVTSTPDPSAVGEATTFVAEITPVAPAAGSPTGEVTFEFSDGAAPVTVPVTGGVATVTRPNPDVTDSPYTADVTYGGDNNFNPSAGSDTHVVTQGVSKTVVTTAPNPSVTGQVVTLSATVAAGPPASGTPTGTVTFDYGDGTATVTVPLSGGGAEVSHAYANASQTPYQVTVTYDGDVNFVPSTGTALHSVDPAATTTTVTAAPDPSVTGEAVTVTVTPDGPGAGIPTGQVTLDFGDGTPILTAELVNGTVTVHHAYTSASGSPYTVTGAYAGDEDFAPSEDTISHIVDPADTTTTVTSSADPAAVGQTVTLIARVTPVPPGAGAPTGTVVFDFGDGSSPVTVPVSGGIATTTHSYGSTAGSPYTVTASYSGDEDFDTSTGTAAQRVEADVSSTSTTVTSSPDPSVVGQTVTFTATVAVLPPASGTATGTVTFEFGDGTAPVTSPVSGAGTATATHVYTAAVGSPYTVTAVYGGDADFAGSAGVDSQTVNLAATTTTLTSAPDPSVTGEPVTFTAAVAPVTVGAGTPTGTVTFDFGDGSDPILAPVADGTATAVHPYAGPSGSPYTITATYNGDASFSASTDTETQTVNQAATSTALFSSPDPTVVGEPVTVTAAVMPVAPGAGTPSGTVTFDLGDGTATVTVNTVGGLATVTHPYATASGSPYTITATYNGDTGFAASTTTDTHTVHPASTATTVTVGQGPTVVGEPVTVTATVATVPPGAGTPTGTVTINFGDATAPVTAPLVGGAVTLTHAYTTALGSPYTITATYNGTADFGASVATATHTVTQDATTTSVTAAPHPSVVGQPVGYTATVAPVGPGGGSPTGTVTFDFGDGTTAAVPVVAGVATADHIFTATSGSPYTVAVTYSGDIDYTGSSDTFTQTVGQAMSTTAVALSPVPSVAGQQVTVTADVSVAAPGAGTPTGTVTFDFGDGSAPVTAPLTAGLAAVTHTWTSSSGSPYAVTADYSGDADVAPSTGSAVQSVAPATTTTAVDTSPDPSVSGEPVAVTATVGVVAPGAGTPTGTVTFDFGDGTPEVTAVVADGSATVSHAWVDTVGSPYTVTATYNGDADFTTSSGTDTQTVAPATTSTSVITLPNPSVTGQPVTFIARVAPDAPGEGTPTGTVTFDFGDGSAPDAVPATGGEATTEHVYTNPTGSPYTATVTYDGDARFTGSVSTLTHTVSQALSTTVVSSAPDPSAAGEPVTVTATVSAVTPGAGTPTGTVTFDLGDGSPAVITAVTGGTATITHTWTTTSGSPYAITAAYSGDTGFTGSTGSDTQTVTPAATTTAVTTSPDPSVAGQPVTVTATVSAVAPGAGTPTGTVTFTFGDGTPSVAAPLAAGQATVAHTWAGTAGSPYTVTADYHGDADFNASTGTDSQSVDQAATDMTLVSSPDPSVAGQEVTFTARVAAAAPGAGAPTGTVTFDFGDGSTPVTATVSAGAATISHSYADSDGSPYTVTANYSGDADFAPATTTDLHTVSAGAATTSTTVVSSPDPSVTGQPVIFTATVAPTPPGGGVPTGTVSFDFGDGTAIITAPAIGGVATVAHSYTATGSLYTVTASYSGDGDFSSSAGSDTHTVGPASTTTTVTSAPDPSVTGQPVTLTAAVAPVAPGAGVPTGIVTFDFGDGSPTAMAPVSGGVARITHTYTAAGGPFTVTADYNGDAGFTASSGTDTQTVGRASTTTAVVSSPDPTVAGQATTITATVASAAPGTGTPTGTVTFTFGDGTPTVTAPVSNGLAVVAHTYAGTSGSPYTLSATYNGDTNFTTSSGTDTQTVNRAATTTTVVSTPDPTVTGQATTITATVASVAPGTGTPTGTVTFTFGDGTGNATATLSGGVATLTHTYAGTSGSPYTLSATYNGDTNFTTSSGTDTQTVNRAATTTTVVSTPDPTVTGQATTITATVASVAPGTGTPTGTVTFTFGDGTGNATATLSGGVATVSHTYATRTGSPFSITATYNADADFTASSGTDTQTVNKANTTTTVFSAPDPSVAGQSVTFTATVAPQTPGNGTPTGTVTFTFGDGTGSTTATLSGGVATVTHPFSGTFGSPYAVTATYNGSDSYNTSNGTDTQTVNRASTTTSVVSTPDPSTAGQSVTLTATVASVPPGAGTPTGAVTFSFGDGTGNATATLSGGLATVTHTYATRTGSPFPVTATYNGDTNFTTSSGTDTQTVGKTATTTTVTTNPDPSVVGQSVTVRATVAAATGAPTGTVTFSFGDGSAAVTAPLVVGIATVTRTYTTTTGSPFTITATYNGSDSYNTSSGTDTQTVNRATTTTAVVSSPNPSTTGDPVTVTATVSAVAPATGTPTGTVTLAIPGRTPQTVTLVNGVASGTFNPLQKGTHTVTANYNGSVNFAPSAGSTTQQVTN
ncbi:Ig-like domain repeat protein [Streptomyces sp. NA02950]|uniref:Ig-like domain repeat protein n=1 Tax=Streptomyces sp. NA02950 TaxID=2742137 RepID=UPI001592038D|nr:Ig-like domain repeat protein [Streptomyces sp. NA02950]QKV91330.1 Ig-like domain repeat protein [Streptomyces sp. NA02950]